MKHESGLCIEHPDRLTSYFAREVWPLTLVTVSGLIYNVGLAAGPWFEGQLVQRLFDIMAGRRAFSAMPSLALAYLAVIFAVQAARAVKRFYVRRFANNTSRNMRYMLYNNILHLGRDELDRQQAGSLMTKAVADVDACAEGMRKFTTEVFDTGIALAAYLGLLLWYDWRLMLISCAFTPLAYLIAQRLKTVVYRYNSAYRQSAGALSEATLDRVTNALTYRVFGREEDCAADYEKNLTDYEQKAVAANIWENTPQPIYNIISMAGAVLILYFGARNIAGVGWAKWDIAAFTTFLACFAKMALKSSKAAKLFNSVQKAQVSWKRIKPLMREYQPAERGTDAAQDTPAPLTVENLHFAYSGGPEVLHPLSFSAQPGQIVGVTGPVACGKSTLGKAFLCEQPYGGSIRVGGRELCEMSEYERSRTVTYLGHQPELLSDTLAENIRLGGGKPVEPYLKAVCMEGEAAAMPQGVDTWVGSGGVQLSGGQQARTALARTLYHQGRVLVLDDPFSAVDRSTEERITQNLRATAANSVVLILSHRVSGFAGFEQVIWMEQGSCTVGTHEALLASCPGYAHIYHAQTAGKELDHEEREP